MPSKRRGFIDKTKAVSFQLVHRSQRDPLAANEEASDYVLKALPPNANLQRSGRYIQKTEKDLAKELEELDEIEPTDSLKDDTDDPALHGIFFEDQTGYDYMQHLKPMGQDPQAVFVGATNGVKLPSGVLPSVTETPVGLLNLQATEINVADPSLDPKVREVLYALDDEAYLQEDVEEDFFTALGAQEVPEEYQDYLIQEAKNEEQALGEGEKEHQLYKMRHGYSSSIDEEDDLAESRDTLGDLPPKHADSKYARTNFSMSSSAMFRNQQLTLLDDRFDQVMKEYGLSDEDDQDSDADTFNSDGTRRRSICDTPQNYPESDDDAVGTLGLDQIDDLMDAFLEGTEVIGRRGRVIPKRDTLLEEGGRESTDTLLKRLSLSADANPLHENKNAFKEISDSEDHEDAWDVETVLSTLSNAYNRPILIQEAGKGVVRIRLKGRNKMPTVVESEGEAEDVEESRPQENKGQARPKKETPEEKRARKAALKDERRSRRAEKKATQKAFKEEEDRQLRSLNQKQRSSAIQSII